MLDNIVNTIKYNRMKYDSYDVDELINDIKKHLNDNIDLLEESFNHEYKSKLDKKILLDCFNKIDVLNEEYKNDIGLVSNIYSPYGVVGLIIKNDISLYNIASIINLIVQSRNSLIIELYKEIGTPNILIELVNQVLEEYKIDIIRIETYIEECNNLDLLLYIGNKEEYKKINKDYPIKYYGIGNYELIVDSEFDLKLINEALKRNVKISYMNKDDFFFRQYNETSSNYCVSLVTENKETARKFLREIKASFLLVNILPTLEKRINIDFNDLVFKKSMIIYEE